MDNFIPPEYMEKISQYIQVYQDTKRKLMPSNDVYMLSATISKDDTSILQKNVSPISDISKTRFAKTISTSRDMEIMGIYNNSANTERFTLRLDSKLGVSDALGVLQYNDASPMLNQIFVVNSQSMRLTEKLDMELKPNDCIIIALMKMQDDGTQGSVDIEIGYNENGCNGMSVQRKFLFALLMVILFVAICFFIRSVSKSSQPKSGFRRRR